MNKKAQGLTINTVVIAVLAILVLVVLFYIFTEKSGGLARQLKVCPGECLDQDECYTAGGTELPGDYLESYTSSIKCSEDGRICCSAKKSKPAGGAAEEPQF